MVFVSVIAKLYIEKDFYYLISNPYLPVMYVVGSKSFRPDIQKPRQMENAVRDI